MPSQTHVIINQWKTDGDMDAQTIRIVDTGTKNEPFLISNPLSRAIVGCQIILRNKPVNCHVQSADVNKIVLVFDADNADINLRVW
jgi:hypothetical protein